jgi:NOL1/NOP2/fmu family ribosome biogenesis protein
MLEFDSDLEVVPGDSFEGRDHGHPEWILSDREEIRYAYRMWPHKIKGEGHFAVLLKKRDGQEGRFSYAKKGAKLSEEAEAFLKEIHFRSEHGRYQEISGKLYWVPEEMPDVKGIRIVRSGLYLGENKKKRFEPSQALAMALDPYTYEKSISLPLQDERVIKYLKCETIDLEGPNGTVLICVDGYPLGWGKLNNGRLKNKYAAAWRWM